MQHTWDADWGTEWALNPFFLHVHPSVAVGSLLSGLTLLQLRIRLFSEQGSWVPAPGWEYTASNFSYTPLAPSSPCEPCCASPSWWSWTRIKSRQAPPAELPSPLSKHFPVSRRPRAPPSTAAWPCTARPATAEPRRLFSTCSLCLQMRSIPLEGPAGETMSPPHPLPEPVSLTQKRCLKEKEHAASSSLPRIPALSASADFTIQCPVQIIPKEPLLFL